MAAQGCGVRTSIDYPNDTTISVDSQGEYAGIQVGTGLAFVSDHSAELASWVEDFDWRG